MAMAVIVAGAHAQIEEGVGTNQFGAGRQNGAYDEVAQVRAAARAYPDRPLVSLDIKNAFGSVRWEHALKLVLTHVPRLAPALRVIWAFRETFVYIQTSPLAWTSFPIRGSLV